jgi:hypothetical protein
MDGWFERNVTGRLAAVLLICGKLGWQVPSSSGTADLHGPERVVPVIPAPMIHVLPQQLNGGLGTIHLFLQVLNDAQQHAIRLGWNWAA